MATEIPPEPGERPINPIKFSRYRSVRRSRYSQPELAPVTAPLPHSQIARTMSRYRKARPRESQSDALPHLINASSAYSSIKRVANEEEEEDESPASGSSPLNGGGRYHQRPLHSLSQHRRQPSAQTSTPPASRGSSNALKHATPPRSSPPEDDDDDRPLFMNKAQHEAFNILNGEAERVKKLRQAQLNQEDARKAKDRQRESEERERARRAQDQKTRPEARPRAETLAHRPAPSRDYQSPPQLHRTPPRSSTHPQPRESQLAANFDAPVSAVNSGARQVTVVCGEQYTHVALDQHSTPESLLAAAAAQLKGAFDVGKSVLGESFLQNGLERPLRSYERVRDVLNSWDRDDANVLQVLPRDFGGGSAALKAAEAPRQQPGEASVTMYYSNKPGSWDKRRVTLGSDGQVRVAKENGSDAKNVCHMSDFDVYMPTARRLRKIEPPKRFCVVVKSQEKASMFLNTQGFLHYFSTREKEHASAWFRALQAWRSWYLVHELGLGDDAEEEVIPVKRIPSGGLLGEAFPSLSMAKPQPQAAPVEPTPAPLSQPPPPSQPLPQRSGTKKLTKARAAAAQPQPTGFVQATAPLHQPEAQPFLSSGLLGRTYTTRQKDMQDRQVTANLPPMPTPGGLVDTLPSSSSFATAPTTALGRTKSMRHQHQPGKPLVDLSADDANPFRRAADRDIGANTIFTPLQTSTSASSAPQDQGPFTGQGLLAQHAGPKRSSTRYRSSRHGGGGGGGGAGAGGGVGVATGDRNATEPLLDLHEASRFAQGSLLAGVERSQGGGGPMVDREKRVEVMERVGEGF